MTYHVDSSFDHKVTSSIIILKIEVSPRQPLGTPTFNSEKGPKSEENDPPPVIRRLATDLRKLQGGPKRKAIVFAHPGLSGRMSYCHDEASVRLSICLSVRLSINISHKIASSPTVVNRFWFCLFCLIARHNGHIASIHRLS